MVAGDHLSHLGVDAIRAKEPNGLDAVLAAILDEQNIAAALELVKPGGAVAYMNNEPPESNLIAEKNIKTEFIHHRPDGKSLGELLTLFDTGELQFPDITTMQLEQAVEAQKQSESGRTRGKLVLEIQSL